MLHTVYSSAVYTVVCAFVSFTNIYWAPTMENKLISNLDVQPSMKVWLLRGQMLFQSSDYRKQGGTLFPCCESFRQEVGEKLKSSSSQKNSPWTSGLSIPLVDKQVLRLPQTEASAALGTGLSNLHLDRPPSDWSLTATATNQLQIFRKMGWVGTIFKIHIS